MDIRKKPGDASGRMVCRWTAAGGFGMRAWFIKCVCFFVVIGVPLCFALSILLATILLWRFTFN